MHDTERPRPAEEAAPSERARRAGPSRRRLLAGLRRKYGEDLRAVMSFAEEAACRLAALQDAEGAAARLGARFQ